MSGYSDRENNERRRELQRQKARERKRRKHILNGILIAVVAVVAATGIGAYIVYRRDPSVFQQLVSQSQNDSAGNSGVSTSTADNSVTAGEGAASSADADSSGTAADSSGSSASSADADNSGSAADDSALADGADNSGTAANGSTTDSNADGSATAADGSSSAGSSSDTASDGADASAALSSSAGASGSEAASTGTSASSRDTSLDAIELMAAQYDYDGAIAALQALPSDQQTAQTASLISQYQAQKEACVPVDVTTVPHIFFHSLINDDRAFNADLIGEDRVRQNNAAMTTVNEFDNMIEDMYEAGYVLVSLDDLCVKTTDADGTVHISKNDSLYLPEGKKAFVLSEDDLSYYHSYGIGTQGYATKMVVDENGKPKCVYTDENGNTSIGDYDVVPRLDSFIEAHPDFAYHGARGTVAMTGYNGVFGYRTNDYYKDINDEHLDPDQVQWLQDHPDFSWEQDCKDAKAVADAMKAEGWTFASHTYGHLNATDASLERLQHDNERWKTVNEPILGKTDKIIFAFGADIGGVGGYTSDNAKFTYFQSEGYNIFCNVDGNIGWTEWGDTYMRTGRVALDGFTMYQAMTDDAVSHTIYANDYEQLGIHDIASFFNAYRPTPIESE